MARWLILSTMLLLVSCGSPNPVDPNVSISGDSVSYVYVDFEDLNLYMDNMQGEMLSVGKMLDEFTVISLAWLDGSVNGYWSGQFTQNLLQRHQLLTRQSVDVRPVDPGLAEVHLLYEDGLRLLGEAYVAFSAQVEVPDSSTWDDINANILEGTLQLVRFQFALSDLVGDRIRFIPL